jgi:hypothetical protein
MEYTPHPPDTPLPEYHRPPAVDQSGQPGSEKDGAKDNQPNRTTSDIKQPFQHRPLEPQTPTPTTRRTRFLDTVSRTAAVT